MFRFVDECDQPAASTAAGSVSSDLPADDYTPQLPQPRYRRTWGGVFTAREMRDLEISIDSGAGLQVLAAADAMDPNAVPGAARANSLVVPVVVLGVLYLLSR